MADPIRSSEPADDPLGLFEPEPRSPLSAPPAKPAAPVKAPPSRIPVAAPTPASTAPPATWLRPAARSAPPIEPPARDDLAFLRTPLPSERMAAAAAATHSPELEPPAPLDFDVEVLGPPPPAGSVSFDHVCAIQGLGFVDGVALIQATSAAVMETGTDSGVPELHGLFLTSTGDVVLHGPPNGERPARDLARLLHQLVAPNLMPPAGRLFVGRWINSDTGGLTEFSSELAYFARPNGKELLVNLHRQCNGSGIQPVTEGRRRPERLRKQREKAQEQPQPELPKGFFAQVQLWMRNHKPEVTAAVAIVAAATAGGLVTWMWAAATAPTSRLPVAVEQLAEKPESTGPADLAPIDTSSAGGKATSRTPGAGQGTVLAGLTPRRPNQPPVANRKSAAPTGGQRAASPPSTPVALVTSAGAAPPVQPQTVTSPAPPAGPPSTVLPSTAVPDLRIYTGSDSGVEPPVLRSPEILEVLLQGFETRENVIELVVSEKGEVQQARMVGAPQRFPDVMLLSRAKELHFDPAVRNGVPVRYRIRLTWRVTP